MYRIYFISLTFLFGCKLSNGISQQNNSCTHLIETDQEIIPILPEWHAYQGWSAARFDGKLTHFVRYSKENKKYYLYDSNLEIEDSIYYSHSRKEDDGFTLFQVYDNKKIFIHPWSTSYRMPISFDSSLYIVDFENDKIINIDVSNVEVLKPYPEGRPRKIINKVGISSDGASHVLISLVNFDYEKRRVKSLVDSTNFLLYSFKNHDIRYIFIPPPSGFVKYDPICDFNDPVVRWDNFNKRYLIFYDMLNVIQLYYPESDQFVEQSYNVPMEVGITTGTDLKNNNYPHYYPMIQSNDGNYFVQICEPVQSGNLSFCQKNRPQNIISVYDKKFKLLKNTWVSGRYNSHYAFLTNDTFRIAVFSLYTPATMTIQKFLWNETEVVQLTQDCIADINDPDIGYLSYARLLDIDTNDSTWLLLFPASATCPMCISEFISAISKIKNSKFHIVFLNETENAIFKTNYSDIFEGNSLVKYDFKGNYLSYMDFFFNPKLILFNNNEVREIKTLDPDQFYKTINKFLP